MQTLQPIPTQVKGRKTTKPSQGNMSSSKLKLDELFLVWLSQSNTQQYIMGLIDEYKTSSKRKKGKS